MFSTYTYGIVSISTFVFLLVKLVFIKGKIPEGATWSEVWIGIMLFSAIWPVTVVMSLHKYIWGRDDQ